MKLTDSIAKILKKNGIKDVFGLQGGAVVHIFDSLEGIMSVQEMIKMGSPSEDKAQSRRKEHEG